MRSITVAFVLFLAGVPAGAAADACTNASEPFVDTPTLDLTRTKTACAREDGSRHGGWTLVVREEFLRATVPVGVSYDVGSESNGSRAAVSVLSHSVSSRSTCGSQGGQHEFRAPGSSVSGPHFCAVPDLAPHAETVAGALP